MRTRRLGRTHLAVSEIGLGTEHLVGQSRESVVSVIREAVAHGITYLDILFCYREYLQNLGAGLRGVREQVVLALHLGCAESDGQYRKTRDIAECRATYEQMLGMLGTDHADVLMLQFVDLSEDFAAVMEPGGLLELALQLRDQGKARFIGMSTHKALVGVKAAESDVIDVIMYPINAVFDSMPGELEPWASPARLSAMPKVRSHDAPDARKALYELCAARDVGLVAMKPYAAGRLFSAEDCGLALTPVQCLHYALAQPGVSAVVPGVKTAAELHAALHYSDADDSERDFSTAVAASQWKLEGGCVYCNHCLPCPSRIDIGRTLRIFDSARHGVTDALRAEYASLPVKASDCIECGFCTARCPFGVSVVPLMRHGVELLGP